MPKVRAGVFEKSWIDLTADDATETPSTPVEQPSSSPVAEGNCGHNFLTFEGVL